MQLMVVLVPPIPERQFTSCRRQITTGQEFTWVTVVSAR